MKHLLMLILAAALYSGGLRAQSIEPVSEPAPAATPEAVYINTHKEQPVVQTMGKTYSNKQLTRMAVRDVNEVAGTVAGVSYRPGSGEVPVINGAKGGTAYYVDGVRVYGAMPIVNK